MPQMDPTELPLQAEVRDWLRDPLTVWALNLLKTEKLALPLWGGANSLEELRRLQGRQEVLDFLTSLPERLKPEKTPDT